MVSSASARMAWSWRVGRSDIRAVRNSVKTGPNRNVVPSRVSSGPMKSPMSNWMSGRDDGGDTDTRRGDRLTPTKSPSVEPAMPAAPTFNTVRRLTLRCHPEVSIETPLHESLEETSPTSEEPQGRVRPRCEVWESDRDDDLAAGM